MAASDTLPIAQEIQRPELTFGDAHADVAAFQFGKFRRVFNLHVDVFKDIERIVWAVVQRALEMLDAHPDDAFLRREQANRKHQCVELPGAFAYIARRNVYHEVISLLLNIEHLHRVSHIQARLN
ncbi:hypothetical protein D3C71_1176280 [compost metagenome]